MKILPSFIVLFLLLVSPAAAELTQSNYFVGNGDVLKISVYDNPDLDTISRIDNVGNIQFPLIGQINVSGLSVVKVTKKIESLLADGYLVDPHVSVFIQEFRSKKVVIMGQVNKSGVLELKGPTTLLELISMAGGLRENAANKISITRKPSAAGTPPQVLNINLQRLLETGDPSLNIQIMDQDNVFIPKAGMIFVTGEVMKPGGYRYEDGATVLKVISMAGDFAEFASKNKIRIIRTIDGKETVLEKVSLQELVFPGDVIQVPESFF